MNINKSLYLSSDIEGQNLYAMRDHFRNNIFRHDKFRPELNTVIARKFFSGVFSNNPAEDKAT